MCLCTGACCAYIVWNSEASSSDMFIRVHLGVCILCCLCEYRTHRRVDMKSHLNKVHPTQEDGLPDLEGHVGTSHCDAPAAMGVPVKDEPL